jgi:hypothetical protein
LRWKNVKGTLFEEMYNYEKSSMALAMMIGEPEKPKASSKVIKEESYQLLLRLEAVEWKLWQRMKSNGRVEAEMMILRSNVTAVLSTQRTVETVTLFPVDLEELGSGYRAKMAPDPEALVFFKFRLPRKNCKSNWVAHFNIFIQFISIVRDVLSMALDKRIS